MAHLSHNNNKRIYCAVWYEKQSGRSGNDIASGTTTIIGGGGGGGGGSKRLSWYNKINFVV